MNKIFYFAIAFIVLLFAILFTFSNYDDGSDPTSPLYEYKNLCSSKYCLPLDNLLINKIVQINNNHEQIGNQFSDWLQNNSEACFVRAQYNKEHKCYFTAYNTIDFNAKYLQFNISSVIHDTIINKDYFDSTIQPEQLIKDELIFNSWQITSQVQKVIVNFLYHLTHLESSKFKSWIQTLPKSIQPLYYNLTQYELNLLEGDNTHHWVLHIVDQYKRDFGSLIQQIRSKKESLKEEGFFNGYKLQLQDYVYARYICDIYGWNIQNQTGSEKKSEKNSKLFLVPGTNCLTKKAPETLMKYDGFHQVENYSQFTFISDRPFSYSDVIEENYEIQDNAIILTLRGISPKDNQFDCVQTQIYDPEMLLINYLSYVMQVAKLLGGVNSFLCLQPKMKQLQGIKYLGNYLNYNATMKKLYYQKLIKTNSSQEKMELIEQWPTIKWDKYNPLEIPLSSINNQIKFYQSQLQNVTDYYNLRQSKAKNTFNAERIKQYIEIKLELIGQVKESVEELAKENELVGKAKKEEIQAKAN